MEKKFTKIHRILHWAIAIGVSAQFITGFLRMKWMGKEAVINSVSTITSALTKDEAVSIYKVLRAPMWEWHIIFAHVVIISFILRIIYMIKKGIKFPNPFSKLTNLKEKFQGLTYIYFYLYLLMAAVTGICLEKGFFSLYKKNIEAVHKLGLYLLPPFIILHIIGVIIAEHKNKKGIVSKMISGD